MSLKFTRKNYWKGLTATASAQEVSDLQTLSKGRVVLPATGKIRLQINGEPETLDGDTGYLVTDTIPYVWDNHIVKSIMFIRETSMSSNVVFEIDGMYNKIVSSQNEY